MVDWKYLRVEKLAILERKEISSNSFKIETSDKLISYLSMIR